MITQIFKILLNGLTPEMLAACYILGVIGFILSLGGNVKKGIAREDNDSPSKFSWAVFVSENWLRVIQVLCALFVGITLSDELLGHSITLKGALFLGAGIDRFVIAKFSMVNFIYAKISGLFVKNDISKTKAVGNGTDVDVVDATKTPDNVPTTDK